MRLIDAIEKLKRSDFLQIAQQFALQAHLEWTVGLQTILNVCYDFPDLAPRNIQAKTPEEVIGKWVVKYKKGMDNRVSKRRSNPPGTLPDDIIDTIMQCRLPDLKPLDIEMIKYAHRLSMSAENILGLLLEEYIAESLLSFGWHCCWGETLRAVDFCHEDQSLLQIKNRSNSENSSSSAIRVGTTIQKWYRIEARTGQTKWDELQSKSGAQVSEEGFRLFVQATLQKNPEALCIEDTNPWQNWDSNV